MCQCHHEGPSLTRNAWPHSTWGNCGKTRRRMATERQINRLPGLLVTKSIWQQISLTNRLSNQSTTPTNKRRQWRSRAKHRWHKSGSPLMRGLYFYKNITDSVTKLTLGLQVGFISSHLTVEKLFPVNPRAITGPPKMDLLLETKGTPALSINPRLILVAHTDDLIWYRTSNQQGQMFVQNLNKIVSKPNVPPGQIPYCTTDCIKIDLFRNNFSTNIQVVTVWAIEMTADRDKRSELTMGAATATVLGQEHQSSGGQVFHHVHWLDRQTCNWSQPDTVAKSKAVAPWRFVIGDPYHSWWWPFKSPANRKEVCRQSKIRSSRSGLW